MCLGILDARLGIFQTGISAACIAEILPVRLYIECESQPTICDKVGNQLVNDLNSMINNKEYSDLIIVINRHEFMAH
jgi:hypothetical protein